MKKAEVVNQILKDKPYQPSRQAVETFAPVNIALCKYWGKRNQDLNIPVTNSLSISLGDHGAITQLEMSPVNHEIVIYNGEEFALDSPFCKRLIAFLDLFRQTHQWHLRITIQSNVPLAAGLASSASGFASMVKALNQFFNWGLNDRELSILARLGSGSASRSVYSGFVEWVSGVREDGMDSYAELIPETWPDLRIGLLIFSQKEKAKSSREAMQITVATSPFYSLWPKKVAEDLKEIKQAIRNQEMSLLGKISESDAMAMHALMLSAWPPISYFLPETVVAMQKIWALRQEGLQIYFTQDAGPNLKLLFLKQDQETILTHFPQLTVIAPFA